MQHGRGAGDDLVAGSVVLTPGQDGGHRLRTGLLALDVGHRITLAEGFALFLQGGQGLPGVLERGVREQEIVEDLLAGLGLPLGDRGGEQGPKVVDFGEGPGFGAGEGPRVDPEVLDRASGEGGTRAAPSDA